MSERKLDHYRSYWNKKKIKKKERKEEIDFHSEKPQNENSEGEKKKKHAI